VHTYKQVFGRHSFVLYFMPWVMFSLVDHLAAPKSPSGEYLLVQAVFMAGAAVLGGFFLDSIGRKPVAIAGFAMLGLGTAVISFLGVSPIVVFFNAMIDGVAYGFLFALFILTLWGDLSNNSSSDKYYALGVMPFFVSQLLGLTLDQQYRKLISTTMGFSFAAVFLFLAVLPLFYARETLPEKIMKERQLKIYVEKAQEIAQKILLNSLSRTVLKDLSFFFFLRCWADLEKVGGRGIVIGYICYFD